MSQDSCNQALAEQLTDPEFLDKAIGRLEVERQLSAVRRGFSSAIAIPWLS